MSGVEVPEVLGETDTVEPLLPAEVGREEVKSSSEV
jgi:hypothetical protein